MSEKGSDNNAQLLARNQNQIGEGDEHQKMTIGDSRYTTDLAFKQEGAGEVLGHSVGVLVHLKEEHQLRPVTDHLRQHHIPVGHSTEHTVAVAVFAIL